MTLAKIRQATTTVRIIEDPEQVKNVDGLVTEDGRKLLTVKGGQTQLLINRILTEFSQRFDRAGNRFCMSKKWRGLSMTDPYGAPTRVTGPDLEALLTEWFLFVELVHSAPPQSHNSTPLVGGQQQYLKVLDKLPAFVTALVNQSRFVNQGPRVPFRGYRVSILLTDLIHLCTSIFRPPPSPRTAARQPLTVPLHESVDKPQMLPVLAAAASQLATSGLLYKWISTDGTPRLVSWNATEKIFVRGTVEDYAIFIGERWIVRDTTGREYKGPSLTVTDRLIQAVLQHPALETASWAEQLRRKREGMK